MFRPGNLSNDVGRFLIGFHVSLHFHVHARCGSAVLQALQQQSVFNADGSGWNLRGIGCVLQCAGVWQLQRQRGDGTNQHANRALLGCLRGSAHTISDRPTITFIRRIEHHNLARHFLSKNGQFRKIAHHHRVGRDAFRRCAHTHTQAQEMQRPLNGRDNRARFFTAHPVRHHHRRRDHMRQARLLHLLGRPFHRAQEILRSTQSVANSIAQGDQARITGVVM